MRMLSIIALSFAFVNVASANEATFEGKISDGKFSVVKGKANGKDFTADQTKELETYLNAATEAYKKAKEGGTATLGMLSGLLAGFGL